MREYQSGAHEPTVLSSLIGNHDYSQANDDGLHHQAYDQLVAELQTKDVHPDCISLHDEYIKKWLQDVAVDGILDERAPYLEDTTPHAPSLFIDIANEDMSDGASVGYPQPSSRTTTPPVHQREGRTWNLTPHDQPDSESVRRILGGLLEADPYSTYRPEAANSPIQRAYHRLDYTQRGYLTRSEVHTAFKEAVAYAGIADEKLDGWNLPVVIAKFDTNQDGRYDEEEFIHVTHQIVQLAFEARKEQLAEALSQCGIKARTFLRQRRQSQIATDTHGGNVILRTGSQRSIPPFGWSKGSPGSTLRFHDHITEKDWQFPPELSDRSFSVMAADAAWCVERIDNLQEKWLAIVPKALRSCFLEDFNTVRTVALGYTLFEKSGHPDELSDLDDFFATYHVVKNLRPGALPEKVNAIAGNLTIASEYSYEILSKVLAFIQIVDEALYFKPTMHRFSDLHSAWRKCQASVASRLVWESSERWSEDVVQRTDKCRRADVRVVRKLRDQAITLAQDHVRHKNDEVELEVRMEQISITGFRPNRSWSERWNSCKWPDYATLVSLS